MGFPAESVNNERLEIVSTRVVGGLKLMKDANGNEWKASSRPLKLELVNAAKVISEDVHDVIAETEEAVDEIADAVGDAIEEVGDSVEELVADVKEEAALIVDEVQDLADELLEDAGELVDDLTASVEDLMDGSSDSEADTPAE
jgi:methyl-accepting chemotaxis protein